MNVDSVVLGVQSEVEETVFPELVLEKELMELEEILTKQPTHRDLLIRKALVLYKLRLDSSANEVLNQLLIIDPNSESVIKLEELLNKKE